MNAFPLFSVEKTETRKELIIAIHPVLHCIRGGERYLVQMNHSTKSGCC